MCEVMKISANLQLTSYLEIHVLQNIVPDN